MKKMYEKQDIESFVQEHGFVNFGYEREYKEIANRINEINGIYREISKKEEDYLSLHDFFHYLLDLGFRCFEYEVVEGNALYDDLDIYAEVTEGQNRLANNFYEKTTEMLKPLPIFPTIDLDI